MHILLTRPYLQSLSVKKDLEACGNIVSLFPVLNISGVGYDASTIRKSSAFVVTSENAAKQLSAQSEVDLSAPIYAVGPATAAPLIKRGFEKVHIADGDAKSLIPIILDNQKPSQGLVTYLSGLDITEDIAEILQKHKFQATRLIVYQAKPTNVLPRNIRLSFQQKDIAAVVFMSFRTALHFTKLLQGAGLSDYLSHIDAVCMSSRVAEGLKPELWKKVHISEKPSLPSLYSQIFTLTDKPESDQEITIRGNSV